MSLDNNQIAAHVETIVAEIRKANRKPSEQPLIEAGAALVTNLLQNLNDLAGKARGDF